MRRVPDWPRGQAAATLLALGIALACGVEDRTDAPAPDSPSPSAPSASPAGDSPLNSTRAASGHDPSVSSQTASAPEAPEPPPAPSPPLEDLLRLPAPIVESHVGSAEREEPKPPETAETSDGKRKNARLGVQVDRQEDPVGFEPSRSRSRTDAGVSVDVDEKTSVRGGVRVEQESEQGRDEPVPTIGIEQRF